MHQKFTKYQEQFLDQKFHNLFAPYPYIFVLQHNSITASEWKKIKKALGDSTLHVVPKKIQHVVTQKQFSAPLCFFGCYSPQDIKLLLKILEDMKLPKYALISLGLFLKNSENGSQFCDFLETEHIIADIEKQIVPGESPCQLTKAQKSIFMNLLTVLQPSQTASPLSILESHLQTTISFIEGSSENTPRASTN